MIFSRPAITALAFGAIGACIAPSADAFSATAAASSSAVVENKSVPSLENGMDYVRLGSSDLTVSKVCMGTMVRHRKLSLIEQLCMHFLNFDQGGTARPPCARR